jgi:hypothetical protein
MSPRLAISAAISILVMAGFVLSTTGRAPEPFGYEAPQEAGVRAEAQTASHSWFGPAPSLFR